MGISFLLFVDQNMAINGKMALFGPNVLKFVQFCQKLYKNTGIPRIYLVPATSLKILF
jgi:NAD dependent epimerase/dehydratase family enzyme